MDEYLSSFDKSQHGRLSLIVRLRGGSDKKRASAETVQQFIRDINSIATSQKLTPWIMKFICEKLTETNVYRDYERSSLISPGVEKFIAEAQKPLPNEAKYAALILQVLPFLYTGNQLNSKAISCLREGRTLEDYKRPSKIDAHTIYSIVVNSIGEQYRGAMAPDIASKDWELFSKHFLGEFAQHQNVDEAEKMLQEHFETLKKYIPEGDGSYYRQRESTNFKSVPASKVQLKMKPTKDFDSLTNLAKAARDVASPAAQRPMRSNKPRRFMGFKMFSIENSERKLFGVPIKPVDVLHQQLITSMDEFISLNESYTTEIGIPKEHFDQISVENQNDDPSCVEIAKWLINPRYSLPEVSGKSKVFLQEFVDCFHAKLRGNHYEPRIPGDSDWLSWMYRDMLRYFDRRVSPEKMRTFYIRIRLQDRKPFMVKFHNVCQLEGITTKEEWKFLTAIARSKGVSFEANKVVTSEMINHAAHSEVYDYKEKSQSLSNDLLRSMNATGLSALYERVKTRNSIKSSSSQKSVPVSQVLNTMKSKRDKFGVEFVICVAALSNESLNTFQTRYQWGPDGSFTNITTPGKSIREDLIEMIQAAGIQLFEF